MSPSQSLEDQQRTVSVLALVSLATAGALFSILQQGYVFGIGNHVYYVPTVLNLPQLPQFANEPFYATLEHYTTWVWPAFAMIANEETIRPIFFAAHATCRTLFFLAFLFWLSQLGIRAGGLIVAAVVLAATPLFTGHSLVGRHNLLFTYFTHTDLTLPLVVMALLLAWRGGLKRAFAVVGIVFNINAFVSAWLGLAIALAWVASRREQYRPAPAALARDTGAMVFWSALTALPTLVWIVQSLAAAAPVDFDYVAYLWDYYPYHFLVGASAPWEIGQLACMVAITLLALVRARLDRFWLYVYLGFILLFAVGAVLPYITASRVLLNLHLLRVDGLIHLMSVVVLLTAALKSLPTLPRLRDVDVLRLAAIAALATGQWYVIFCTYVLLLVPELLPRPWRALLAVAALLSIALLEWVWSARPIPPPRDLFYVYLALFVLAVWLAERLGVAWIRAVMMPVAVAAVLVPAGAFNAYRNFNPALKLSPQELAWADAVDWVRRHPKPGEYMVPAVIPDNADLQLSARVPVWVDWRRGAAVQWAPAYYHVWHDRYNAIRAADTPASLYRLACRHGVPNVVAERAGVQPPVAAPDYENGYYGIYRVQPSCRAG